MNSIAQKLEWPQEVYDYKLLDTFTKWCGIYAKNIDELQQFLTNQALFNCFQDKYKQAEQEFLHLTKPFNTLTVKDYRNCYEKCVSDLYKNWPPSFGLKKKVQGIVITSGINLSIKYDLN